MKKGKQEKTQEEKEAQKEFTLHIVAFVCKWCANLDGTPHGEPKAVAFRASNVKMISVMCSGRVHPSLVLKAFELGADGVIVCGCKPGRCHYYTGNEQQAEMFETSKKLTGLLGLEPQRLRLEWLCPDWADELSHVIGEFREEISQVGPSPLRRSGGTG